MQDLRHLPAMIYECAFLPDGSPTFNYVSEQSLEVLGLRADALIQNPALLQTCVFPADQACLDEVFSKPCGGQSQGVVQVRVTVGGHLKRVHVQYNDALSADGVLLRRGVVQEARDGRTRFGNFSAYEALLKKLPIGVVIHHAGVVTFANTHAHAIMGAKAPGDLHGRPAMDFVLPEYKAGITERIQQVLAGQSVPMVEEKFIRLDGTVIDVETMGFPFLYMGRECVQVVFRDITERKQAEVQIRKNEALFTQLFNNIPLAVVMLDETGKISQVNRGFEQMFGYERDELKGKNVNDYIVPEDLQSEGIDLNNLIASNKVVSIESIRKHRSGRLLNVMLYGMPVMQDTQVIGIYGVYVDITEQKQVEEELKIRNAELDHFVYKVSHDLRAPLSSVLGLVNLSRFKGNDDNLMTYMDLIGEKIQTLDNFIGDVLSHSKNLNMEVDIGHVDLRRIIEDAFADLAYLSDASAVKRSIQVEGIDFYSDQWRISEIVRNLAANAIKYRRKEVDSEIVIKIQVDHLCAEITFADNGIGIKEASLDRIFDMFYRATEESDGSGIGLYIVKNAVEKLGGQIKVASSLGLGTRFHILLPNRINSILNAPDNAALS